MKNDSDKIAEANGEGTFANADPLPSTTERLLQRYHDAELRPSEIRDFEARLQVDPGLRAQLASLEQAADFLAADSETCEPAPLAMGFADRLFSRIDSERAKHEQAQRGSSMPFGQPSFKRWIAIAASFLVFLLAAHAFTPAPFEDDLSAKAIHSEASRKRRELLDHLDRMYHLDRKGREKDALLGSPSQLNAEKGTVFERKK